MTSHARRLQLKALAAIAGLASAAGAAAQSAVSGYPSREIRFIVPFPPGGGNDILARMLGPKMAEALGRPVVIDNRPGAGGNLANEIVVKAAPDTYSVLIASSSLPPRSIRTCP